MFLIYVKLANLTPNHLLLGQKMSDEYKGAECLKLLNHSEEKAKMLTLSDYLCRKDEGQFDMIDFADDAFSIVKLYKHIIKHFMYPKKLDIKVPDCFFRRHAAQKVIKVSKRLFKQFTYVNQLCN